MRYVAVDVETPNRLNNRMSSIGICIIEDGKIVDEFYSLVNPDTYFDSFNIGLTGINEELVKDAPNFLNLWPSIEQLLASGLLIAHNASFDMNVLKKCLIDYQINWKPYFHYACTVQMGRSLLPGISHKLNDLCDYYDLDLDHHNALSDSRACANILLKYLDSGIEINDFIRTCSIRKNNA